jgi:hypothetical protein
MRIPAKWLLGLPVLLLIGDGMFGMGRPSYATLATATECLIPPTFDPGIGGVYYCPPSEGEQHLIALARRAATETGLNEDVWVNFRGIFRDRVWVNVGLQESGSTALPAWDAIASLVTWMRAIKAGDSGALETFLAPLEVGPTYSQRDRVVQQQLLAELQTTAKMSDASTLRIILYHVHLLPTRQQQKAARMPLNPWLSLPSQEDLSSALHLAMLLPDSEAKIAVPAGIWTYTWDKEQATHFVSKHYKGRTDASFAAKFRHLYLRYALTEYRRQGLYNPAALTPERMRDYVVSLRATGAVLHFAFAPDWTTLLRGATP